MAVQHVLRVDGILDEGFVVGEEGGESPVGEGGDGDWLEGEGISAELEEGKREVRLTSKDGCNGVDIASLSNVNRRVEGVDHSWHIGSNRNDESGQRPPVDAHRVVAVDAVGIVEGGDGVTSLLDEVVVCTEDGRQRTENDRIGAHAKKRAE